jgi:hypothetical protein
MFASSLPSVVCRRVHILSCFCVFLDILMSNILLLLFFLVFCVVFFALYQVVPVAWTNRIWHKLLYKHTMYVMGFYQLVWREAHYDVTDEKNNVRVEGLNTLSLISHFGLPESIRFLWCLSRSSRRTLVFIYCFVYINHSLCIIF